MSEAVAALRTLLEQAPGLARALPPHVARFLLDGAADARDALDALDDLAFCARRSQLRPRLLPRLDEARSALPLDARRFRPAPGPLPRDLAWAEKDVKVTEVPWPAARGTVVALAKRGSGATAPHVHVASGAPRTTRLDVLEAALVAIEAASPSREDHERLLRLVDDSERDDPRANSEASVRFAVGCIERARAIPKAREVALAFLASSGISPIALAAGERFDADRHGPSAFERRLVRGPKGRVVATETTGFRDAAGVVLARAVVAVGEGA